MERKRSDALGAQWSKEELRQFYRAYRKYGKDWEKVAKISGKPPETVKALYKMNEAFLTLPEGKSTEDGFIARMTDHCNRLDRSHSKKGRGQVVKTYHKIQKYGYKKLQLNIQKGSHEHNRPGLQTNSAQFNSVQLDSPKLELSKDLFDGSQPPIVRKRTPRFPVSTSLDENDSSSRSRNNGSANLVALSFQEASMRVRTPNSSQMLRRTTDNASFITSSSDKTRHAESKITNSARSIDKMGQDSLANCRRKTNKRKSEDFIAYQCDPTRDTSLAAKQVHDVGNSKVGAEKNVEDGKKLGHVQHSKLGTDKFFTEFEVSAMYALQDLVDLFRHHDKFVNHGSKNVVEKLREHFSSDGATVASGDDTKAAKVLYHSECTSSETKKNKKLKASFVEGDSSNGNYLAPQHGQGNNIHTVECSSLNIDLGRSVANSSESTLVAPSVSHQNMPTRNRARWKTSLQKKMEKHSDIPSSYMLRRWCAFEWFYSAIDYPWFAKNKFAEYVNDLGVTRKLTRTEWSIIRSSLGKARRFSVNFLSEERRNLEKYRESVRELYAELFVGARDSIPKDIARPLSVDQLVRVHRRRTRELSNGKILYVAGEKCKVQFDSPDSEEVAMDIDCMPVNWRDNLPEDHRERITYRNRLCNKLEMDHNAKKRDCGNADLRENDASKQPTSNQSLKEMENLVSEGEQNDENVGGDSEIPWEQDGIVQIPTHEGSDEVHSPLQNMMMNDAFRLNAVSLGFQMSNNSGLTRCDAYDYDSLSSHAAEIVEKSILEARRVVDFTIMEEPNPQNGPETTDVASSEAETSAHLSELMSACVSTLSIIKGLSERRFPPAMGMQILEHALYRLQPKCSRNLSIYRDIEKYMGIIKSQMLALLPTNISL